MKEKIIEFEEFEMRIRDIAKKIKKNKKIKDIYGVPRSGLIPAIRLSYLLDIPRTINPKYESTAIIDDISDSGTTKHSFGDFKYFFALIDKKKENIEDWIIFWWNLK